MASEKTAYDVARAGETKTNQRFRCRQGRWVSEHSRSGVSLHHRPPSTHRERIQCMCWCVCVWEGALLNWSKCNRQRLVQGELVTELDPQAALQQAAVSTVTSSTKTEEGADSVYRWDWWKHMHTLKGTRESVSWGTSATVAYHMYTQHVRYQRWEGTGINTVQPRGDGSCLAVHKAGIPLCCFHVLLEL